VAIVIQTLAAPPPEQDEVALRAPH
jgi:hypothetical protein